MTIPVRALFACATTLFAAPFSLFTACSSSETPAGTGGVPATGGVSTGGVSTGGVLATGGTVSTTGGVPATGGTVSTTGGVLATGGTPTGGTSSGGNMATGGGGASSGAGGVAGSAGSSGAGGAGGTNAGAAGNAGTSGGGLGGGSGGGAGGKGGGAGAGAGGGGAGGAGGAAGGGGAGGTTCGTLGKATDGGYVRTGWTAEYTCTGTCPAKNQADTGDVATRAFDNNYQTRWSTGVYQSALNQQNKFPLFFTVDMKTAVPVSKITTHPGCQDIFDSPGTIEVQVSTDGTNFTTVSPVAPAAAHAPVVPPNEACPPSATAKAIDTITFTSTCARYIRLKGTQRTTSDRYWAIGEMNVYP